MLIPYSNNTDLNMSNLEIGNIKNWCSENKLDVNYNKSKILDIKHRNSTFVNIALPCYDIEKVQRIKLLGVIFNNQLNWKDHFIILCKKANQRLWCLEN